MNQARIDELRALCEAATLEPWIAQVDTVMTAKGPLLAVYKLDKTATQQNLDDIEFAAAARTALPEVLDEIEALYAITLRAVELLAESFDFWSARNIRDNAEKIKEIKALAEIVKTPL